MFNKFTRIILLLACTGSVLHNLNAIIEVGTKEDWENVKALSRTMHTDFYKALAGESGPLLLEQKLDDLHEKLFGDQPSHELLVCKDVVNTAGALQLSLKGFIAYTTKQNKAWVTSSAFEKSADVRAFADTFINYLQVSTTSQDNIALNMVYGMLPKGEGEIFDTYHNRLVALGFSLSSDPAALDEVQGDKATAQGYEMRLDSGDISEESSGHLLRHNASDYSVHSDGPDCDTSPFSFE